MTYALESTSETVRLEAQSKRDAYDLGRELKLLAPELAQSRFLSICDVGCGSGVLSRKLATLFPDAVIHAVDQSELRVCQAKQMSEEHGNIRFEHADVLKLQSRFSDLDAVFFRYVLQHLSRSDCPRALEQAYRCMKPGGTIHIIDIDGMFFNLHPLSERLQVDLAQLHEHRSVDLNIGRKLPSLLLAAGFHDIQWKIETLNFHGEPMAQEIELMTGRFAQATGFLKEVFGTSKRAERFKTEYLGQMKKPGTVLFYNKFLITAKRNSVR